LKLFYNESQELTGIYIDKHQVMTLNFHIKDAPSFRIYPEGKSVQGHRGMKDFTRAKVGEMFLSRNEFGKFLDIS